MALSHICLGCGLDLARQRAVPDPHYGLPIVVCAACGTGALRRPGMRLGWRGGRRVRRAVLALALQTGLGLFLLGASVGLSIGFVAERTSLLESLRMLGALIGGSGDWGDYDATPAIFLLSLTAISIFTGTWLTAGLAHCSRWRAFLVWAVVLQVAVFAAPLAAHSDPPAEIDAMAAAPAYSAVAAMLGIPVGWAIQRALRARGHAVFARRRQRRRRGHA